MNSCDHQLMDMFVISTKVNANRFKFCLSLSEMESLIPIWINGNGGIQHLNTIEVYQPCNKFLHIGSSLNMYNRQRRRKTPKNIFHYSICSWKKKIIKMNKVSTSFVLILFAVVSGISALFWFIVHFMYLFYSSSWKERMNEWCREGEWQQLPLPRNHWRRLPWWKSLPWNLQTLLRRNRTNLDILCSSWWWN